LRLFENGFLRKTLDKSKRKLKGSEERCIMRSFEVTLKSLEGQLGSKGSLGSPKHK
jgi:hypothetical protein